VVLLLRAEGDLRVGGDALSHVYIIALNALTYIVIVGYTADMTAPKIEHQERIADVRNSLADVIAKARYYDETTVLTSRKKRVAVIVSMEFYERALAALGEERVLAGSAES
jgi:prevent-host-death family protein